MTIAYRSQTVLHTSGSSSTQYNDVTINTPAGVQAGDLLLLVGCTDHSFFYPGHFTLPSGWVMQYNSEAAIGDYGADGQSFVVIYKVATASEPASYTFTGGLNYDYQASFVMRAYSGVDNTTPLAAWVRGDPTGTQTAETGGNHYSLTGPAITTPVANCLVVVGYVPDAPNELCSMTTVPTGFSNSVVEPPNPTSGLSGWWSYVALCEQLVTSATTVA